VVFIIARLFLKQLFQPATRYFVRLCTIYIILSEQPGIIGFMTSFLSCSQDDPYSSPYVGLHPSTKCNTSQYFTIKYFIVIPCLVLWVALIPVYGFLSIYFKRDRLNTIAVRLPWGVLYNLYKPRFYWWGIVSMLLAISLGFTTYFFQGDPKTCLALAFILLWTYQIAVRRAKPYKYDSWNKMEASTIGLLVLNLMLGYLTINTPNLQLKIGGYIILAVVNGARVSYIIYKIVSRKVVTFVDKVTRRITSKRQSKKKRSRINSKTPEILESFIQNDVESARTESKDTLQVASFSSQEQNTQDEGKKHSSYLML